MLHRARVSLLRIASGGCLVALAACGPSTTNPPPPTPDTTAPAEIADLAVTATAGDSITLGWTAVGDDGATGTAKSQELRSLTGEACPITKDNFATGQLVSALGAPQAAGAKESITVGALQGETHYCFRVQVTDDAGNASLSNLAESTTPDGTAPGAPQLTAGARTATTIEVKWTAVGDDGATGTAKSQELRWATGAGCPLTRDTFGQGTAVAGLGAPKAAGQAESIVVPNLAADSSFCFALQVSDEGDNSVLSNSLSAQTTDEQAPAQAKLVAGKVSGTSIEVTWTAVGDNADQGTATAYELRSQKGAACATFDASSFAQGTLVQTGAPKAAGEGELVAVNGLDADTAYCFLLQVRDEANNASLSTLLAQATADVAAPAAISDLSVASVFGTRIQLAWTATGDNEQQGTAASYAIFYGAGACPESGRPADATVVANPPVPQIAGSPETFAIAGLLPRTSYCVGLEVSDEAGHTTASNLVSFTSGPLDPVAPGKLEGLAATVASSTSVQLTWKAPADDQTDASSGAAAKYDLRYVTGANCAMDAAAFANATPVNAIASVVPAAPGSEETFVVSGLPTDTSFCFGLVAFDETPNASPLAAFPAVRTPDVTAPDAPQLTLAEVQPTDTAADFSWTSVGDDADVGTAAHQELRSIELGGCPASLPQDLSGWAAHALSAPMPAGLPETAHVDGLAPGRHYCFVLVIADEAGNEAFSNIVSVGTPDTTAPDAAVLAAGTILSRSVEVTWTAVGDDGAVGTADHYELRSVQAADCTQLDQGVWATANLRANMPAPQPSGVAESVTVTGLAPGKTYCFQLTVLDDALNSTSSDVLSATTAADTTPPAAPVITLASASSTSATVRFTAVANDGTDAASGRAFAYDVRVIDAAQASACAQKSADDFAGATRLTTNAAPGAPGSSELVSVLPATVDGTWCLALRVIDDAQNASPVSNWIAARDTTAPAKIGDLTVTASAATSLTLGFTAVGDDDKAGSAASYDVRYQKGACPSDASGFDFANAAAVTGLGAPKAAGQAESITVGGLLWSQQYCLALRANDEVPNHGALALVGGLTTTPDVSAQIAAIRTAIGQASASPVTLNLPINGGIVTYTKGAVGGAAVGTSDGPGFFLQNGDAGPAILVALDPASFAGGVAVGDVLDLQVTQGAWLGCTTAPCTASNSMYVVTAATGRKVSGGATLPATQDISGLTLTLPIAETPWSLEHERIAVTGTVGALTTTSTGFVQGQLTTAKTTSTSLQLRVSGAVASAAGLAQGCKVQVDGVPLWRTDGEADVVVTKASELTVSLCPVTVAAWSPADGASYVATNASISITFDRAMDPTTLVAQTADGTCAGTVLLSKDNGFTAGCVAFAQAAPTMNSANTVATWSLAAPLTAGARYRLRVTNTSTTSITTTEGTTLLGGTPIFQLNGFTAAPASTFQCTPGQVVISQVYGGGGNGGAQYKNDFIELHNRGSTAVSLAGWSVQYGSSSGTSSWLTTALTGTIPAGGYFLVQEAAGTTTGTYSTLPSPDVTTGSINMSGTAGKVALVSSTTALSGACPTGGQIVDLVGYGSGANCSKGGPTIPTTNSTSIMRTGLACLDSANNFADFVTGAPTPHNSASAANACSCGGGTGQMLNETDVAGEADYCVLQYPQSLLVAPGATTDQVYGRLYESSVTPTGGANTSVKMEVGYGPTGSDPATQWAFYAATYNNQCSNCGNNDEFSRTLTAPAATGTYDYTVRFSLDGGTHWTYCDTDGAGSNSGLTFERSKLGQLTVTNSSR